MYTDYRKASLRSCERRNRKCKERITGLAFAAPIALSLFAIQDFTRRTAARSTNATWELGREIQSSACREKTAGPRPRRFWSVVSPAPYFTYLKGRARAL